MIGLLLFIQIPVIFSLSIGEEIDRFERDRLKIFPEIENFQKAYAFKINKDYKLIIKTSSDSFALNIDSLHFYQFIEYIDYFAEINKYPEIKKEFKNKWKNKGAPLEEAFFLGKLETFYPVEKIKIKHKESAKIYKEKEEITAFEFEEIKKGDILYPDDPLSKITDFDYKGIPITKFEINAVKGIKGRVGGILSGLFLGTITYFYLTKIHTNGFTSFFIPVFTLSFTGYLIGNKNDEEEAVRKIKYLREKGIFLPSSLMYTYTYDKKRNPILRAEIEARKGFGWRGVIGVPLVLIPLFIPYNFGIYLICDYFDTEDAVSRAKKFNIRDKDGIPFYLKKIYHATQNR